MDKQRSVSSSTAAVIGAILLVLAALLGFLAAQCLTTDMYKLYSAPYQGSESRCAYYEQQAQVKRADAQLARSQGQETIAISYENIALSWERNAEEARSYLQQHLTGAIALGVGGLLLVVAGLRMLIVSRRRPVVKAPAQVETPSAPPAEQPDNQ